MFDEFVGSAEKEIVRQVYPESTHAWVRLVANGPEVYDCSRCKYRKIVYNDVIVVVYDLAGNPVEPENATCEYAQVAEVMEE